MSGCRLESSYIKMSIRRLIELTLRIIIVNSCAERARRNFIGIKRRQQCATCDYVFSILPTTINRFIFENVFWWWGFYDCRKSYRIFSYVVVQRWLAIFHNFILRMWAFRVLCTLLDLDLSPQKIHFYNEKWVKYVCEWSTTTKHN